MLFVVVVCLGVTSVELATESDYCTSLPAGFIVSRPCRKKYTMQSDMHSPPTLSHPEQILASQITAPMKRLYSCCTEPSPTIKESRS